MQMSKLRHVTAKPAACTDYLGQIWQETVDPRSTLIRRQISFESFHGIHCVTSQEQKTAILGIFSNLGTPIPSPPLMWAKFGMLE